MNVLTECLAQGTSPVGVVSFAKEYLKQQGFEELYYNKMISPKENSKYYIAPFPDVLFAFTTGAGKEMIQSLRMAFAHVDQPCFKVKGKPDFKSMGCAMLNVEVYGGMMDHTWFDRPLGLAGTIVLKGEDVFNPIEVTYNSKRPVALIPGLAIHMQREANNGWKIDRQKELMPLMGLANGRWTEDAFLHFLAEELSVDESEESRRKQIEREAYYKIICHNIGYEYLIEECDREMLDEIVALVVDVISSDREFIWIGRDRKPFDVVKSQFLKLNAEHIRFVMKCLRENTSKVVNIRQYLLTVLYNAPLTISNYYSALVQHDMYGNED